MNLKITFKWVAIFLYPCFVTAQKISIGETLPEMELSNVINYRSDKLKISDFKGKLVILDFWNHYCSACIKSFPKLDSLQKNFNNDIQIILVNSESKDSTRRFFEKRPKIKHPDLIMITGDRKLSELFPAEGYPYCVWVDASGKVQYFSGSHVISIHSISKFLSGQKQFFINPTVKRFGSPLSSFGFGYYSYISKCNDTLNIGNSERVYNDKGNTVNITSNCSSVIELFRKAYSEKGKYNFDTKYSSVVDFEDSNYRRPSDPEMLDIWSVNHSYNYELSLPGNKSAEAYTIMQVDLGRYFPIKAYVKEVLIKSIVLYADDTLKIKSKGGATLNTLSGPGSPTLYSKNPNPSRYLNNQPYSQLSQHLRLWIQYYYPFFDEVGMKDNIDIRINESSINPFNIDNLTKDLNKAGLKLVIEERLVPVLFLQQIQKENK